MKERNRRRSGIENCIAKNMDARSPGKCETTYIVLALGLGEFSFTNRDMCKNRLGKGWEGFCWIPGKVSLAFHVSGDIMPAFH